MGMLVDNKGKAMTEAEKAMEMLEDTISGGGHLTEAHEALATLRCELARCGEDNLRLQRMITCEETGRTDCAGVTPDPPDRMLSRCLMHQIEKARCEAKPEPPAPDEWVCPGCGRPSGFKLTPAPSDAEVEEARKAAHASVGWFGGWQHGMAEKYQPSDETWKKALDEAHADIDRLASLARRPEALPCGHPASCEGLAGQMGDEPGCGWCGDMADMKVLVDHLSRTYDHFSGGRISKAMTEPEEVFRVADDLETERFEEWQKERGHEQGKD